jgi:hypothetical protein
VYKKVRALFDERLSAPLRDGCGLRYTFAFVRYVELYMSAARFQAAHNRMRDAGHLSSPALHIAYLPVIEDPLTGQLHHTSGHTTHLLWDAASNQQEPLTLYINSDCFSSIRVGESRVIVMCRILPGRVQRFALGAAPPQRESGADSIECEAARCFIIFDHRHVMPLFMMRYQLQAVPHSPGASPGAGARHAH